MFKKYDKDKQHLIIHNHKERRGGAWQGWARLGKAWPGTARRGLAWQGKGALCPYIKKLEWR